MNHEKSLLYFWLVTNSVMAFSLGGLLPWVIVNTARSLRYMQNFRARLFGRLAAAWVASIGSTFLFDIINTHFWTNEMLHAFVGSFVAVFTISFGLVCVSQRHLLQTLYPKEEFVIEQEKRLKLLNKMLACDSTMPLPRIESNRGRIIYANQAAENLLEYSRLELHRMDTAQFVHVDDRSKVLATVLNKKHDTYECRIITASGRLVHVEVRSTHDPENEDVRITFLTDVTNYVEQRDRYLRDFRLNRSQATRREAEDNLLVQLTEPDMAEHWQG